MNVDRICQYIESKLPRSTWEFHGLDIRRFIEKEMVESAVVPVDFTQLSKVDPESMREVIGVDTTGVISDVREIGRTLTHEEVAAVCRGEEVPCEASS